jgi:hypothetical protein
MDPNANLFNSLNGITTVKAAELIVSENPENVLLSIHTINAYMDASEAVLKALELHSKENNFNNKLNKQ